MNYLKRYLSVMVGIAFLDVFLCIASVNTYSSRLKRHQISEKNDSFWVGSKRWPLKEFTAKGIPVVEMWNAKDVKDSSAYSLLNAEHQIVWRPANKEAGGYNHYCCLIRYKSKFFAMWANNLIGEDAAGQRILYSVADRWDIWSSPKVLFPEPCPINERSFKGIHLKPDRWIILNDELFAVVYVHGAGIYPIARRIRINGKLDHPFLIDALPDKASLPQFMNTFSPPAIAGQLKNWYRTNNKVSWWADKSQGVQRTAIDGNTLIESFMYKAKDNTLVLMFRNWGSPSHPVHNNRIYVTFSKDYHHWNAAYPTNIPDAPTRSEALRLDDGTVLLIGTQVASQLDEALYLDRDPLTISVSKDGFHFDKIFRFRIGAPKKWHIPGVTGRTPGFAYTSSFVAGKFLYTLYSVGKEDINISRVRLNEILK